MTRGLPQGPDTAAEDRAGVATSAVLPAASRIRRNLLPGMHAPMRTFMVAVAVMVYLATLAAGAVLLVQLATTEWTAGVVSEATAQVLPKEGEGKQALMKRAVKAARVLERQEGVRRARVLPADETRKLLKPWLGQAGLELDLPLPVLIAITLTPERPAEVQDLQQALRAANLADVQVDAHGRWVRELADMSRTAWWLGMGVLALLVVALVLLVGHAARAALQANSETLQVLHLIGAQDKFIAAQVERHFLRSSFLAAFTGVVGTWISLMLLALLAPVSGLQQIIFDLLLFDTSLAVQTYVFWLLIMVSTILISLVVARVATMRILADMFRGA